MGIRVVEFAAIGPIPFCGMLLADMGAEVIRIERPAGSDLGVPVETRFDHLNRGKRSLSVDLKHPAAHGVVHALLARSDVLLEGFRPGTMERLGFGPATVLAARPTLVYGRITGWGSTGPLAAIAGHDLNFIAASGALAAMGEPGVPPPVPLNLIGDFGGAAMHLACGILAALVAAKRDGLGQVVETSIAAGSIALTPMLQGLRQAGIWSAERADNILDGGAPFYRNYATQDARYVAVGAIEAKFYRALLDGLGLLNQLAPGDQMDRANWPETTRIIAERFAAHTNAHWLEVFAGSDACVTPVLNWDEAPSFAQHVAAGHFETVAGQVHPAPQPVLSRTPSRIRGGAPTLGEHNAALLADLGYSPEDVVSLEQQGVTKML
ncbi:CaiB/BaiF CoA-transferase family protein [Acidisphaera sp. L21]|uniref:CaiB/BaiF CoA transferase family protein n=1 Tax=Acidisphaera sp. L21 TaxID=1641851 RepID=UPI001C2069BB|nr:CaiB/BaiF CoA-transferase family protein [Acidisphaera sp. L21]